MEYKDSVFGMIPASWDIKRASDIVEIVTDYVANGSFKSLAENVTYNSNKDYAVLIRLKDYNANFNEKNFVYVDKKGYEFLKKSRLFGGEIIISNVGDVGTVFKCPHLNMPMTLGPNSITVKFKGCNDFYYYWMKSPIGHQMLLSIVTGSAQPKFNKTNFKELLFPVPPLPVQEQIASVLCNIDTLIESNENKIKLLEEKIAADVSHYFPYYDDEDIDGWKKITLDDIAVFTNGYSYKGTELDDNKETALVTIKNFERGGGFKLDGFKGITPSSKAKKCHEVELFDTLVAHTDLTQKAEVIGKGEMLLSKSKYKKVIMSMDLVKVETKNNISKFLLAGLLNDSKFKNHCLKYVNGSTVLHMSKNALPEYKLLFPESNEYIAKISSLLENSYRLLSNLIQTNIQLVDLRDSLLSKLMSGRIDLSSIDDGDY